MRPRRRLTKKGKNVEDEDRSLEVQSLHFSGKIAKSNWLVLKGIVLLLLAMFSRVFQGATPNGGKALDPPLLPIHVPFKNHSTGRKLAFLHNDCTFAQR